MFMNPKTLLRAALGLLLACSALQPLRAQFSQNSDTQSKISPSTSSPTYATDFTDLFKQSGITAAKPEMVSIFDFSRSMASLMFHPVYRNLDLQDQDAYRYMTFTLTSSEGAGGAVTYSTYTITAKPHDGCTSATASVTVKVGSDGSISVNPNGTGASCGGVTGASSAPSNYALKVQAGGNSSANATLYYAPVCNTNTGGCNGTNYSLNLSKSTATGIQGTSVTTYPGQYTITHGNETQSPTPVIEAYTDSGHTISAGSGPFAPNTTLYLVAYLYHPTTEGDPIPPTTAGTSLTSSYSAYVMSWSGGASGGATKTTSTPGLYMSTATWTVPNWTYSAGTANPNPSTQLQTITVSSASGYALGSTLTMSTYFITGSSTSGRIDWSIGASNNCATLVNPSPTNTTGNTTTSAGGSVTWVIPNCKPSASASTIPIVQVSLDATASPYMSTPAYSTQGGVAALGVTMYTSTDAAGSVASALRKPDGSAVLYTDVDAATISLPGGAVTPHANDVRNWIRAASHVRFTYGNRTLDIPIPWKIFDTTSKSIPLASSTVTDTQTKNVTNADGTITTSTYGTGNAIEMDRCYSINSQNGAVLTTDTAAGAPANSAGQTTTVYLYTAIYRPAYIAWLFNGMYQNSSPTLPYYTTDSSLAGHYIVFNAVQGGPATGTGSDPTNTLYGGAGQGTHFQWGQGAGNLASTDTTDTVPVPQYALDGTLLKLSSGAYAPSLATPAVQEVIPYLTRAQAIKQAAITTWTQHQADIYWAFRCLDTTNEALTSGSPATQINNNSKTTLTAGDPTSTHIDGMDSGWTLLNSASVTGMNRIASLFANGGTPLTYAMARTLAQYGDPNSVFNAAEGTSTSQCVSHFLLMFTDGVDNNGIDGSAANPSASPYIDTSTGNPTLSIVKGNTTLMANTGLINPGGSNWNLHTYAGIGAHLGDMTLGTGNYMAAFNPGTVGHAATSQAPSGFLPDSIYGRNGTTFNVPPVITTMTVGVSLGGVYTDPNSPKYSLYLAAVEGKPKTSNNLVSYYHPFTIADFNSISNTVSDPAVFFFDASNVGLLNQSMADIFVIIGASNGNGATASPTLPFIGASLGQEIYMGSFTPPTGGGVIWPGDLMMFGLQDVNGVLSYVNKAGTAVTNLTKANAIWAASDALATGNRYWDAATKPSTSAASRNLWTRLPSTGTAEPSLTQFTYTGKPFDDGSGGGLQKYVATAQSYSQKQVVVQRAMGGDTVNTGTPPSIPPTANRADIMGDIINAAPNAVTYTLSDWSSSLPSTLSSAQPADGSGTFRLILAGTNQGWVHAFGEVTSTKTAANAAVDELWAFMPTDFLNNLDYLNTPGNPHKLMVDGPPAIYFLDLPTASGVGNGKIDSGERAIAIIGLGKGGRSYYALDISNPLVPKLKWSLVPDEMANFDTTRNKTPLANDVLEAIISHMGYATGTPAIGRITLNNVLRDAVFLGGGFSTPAVDSAFGTPMGRSVVALDVYTGEVLAAVDLTTITLKSGQKAIGPVGSGLIPFEFIVNSGMAQRAYFLDYTGGLFSWGSKALGTGSYAKFRADSAELSSWNIRRVFQDDNTMAASGSAINNRYTTPPAPFRVGSFPAPVLTGEPTPAGVGIAMVSGDRNNPADQYPSNGSTSLAPSQHQLTVVFDRQDSFAAGLDDGNQDNGPDTGVVPAIGSGSSELVALPLPSVTATPGDICGGSDASSKAYQVFTPGCTNFFLGNGSDYTKWKYGYYVNFTAGKGTPFYIPKGINPPSVDANSLFYSYFTPTSYDFCSGGQGNTTSNLIADVMHPIYSDTRSNQSLKSGVIFTWAGVASNYITVGTQVLQGGTITNGQNGIVTGSSTPVPYIDSTQTNGQRHPRARVWRTVQ